MNVLTVCKNVIASNNKRGWRNPDPAIRIARTKSGAATERANKVDIVDAKGNVVAWMESTTDGKAIVKCGAKVALTTVFPVRVAA